MVGIDVFLVEDNRYDTEMILDAFSDQGLNDGRILAVNDGAKALDYFFGQEDTRSMGARLPRLIVLDLKLPKVNGLEVLRRLKADERTQNIPVVIFTSSGEPQDKRDSYQLGANSYIVKPLDSDKFAAMVNKIGTYWLSANQTVYSGN
ncbi:MAG: Response regulator rcp1 [Syntrophus sp. SKADARSKE-3]|nr:Response regulator rcp1 [Syntrophus sp. SKADARSKE-3]